MRELDSAPRRDILAGLPNVEQFQRLAETNLASTRTSQFAFLLIDVAGLSEVIMAHGQEAGDEVLRHVVRQARSCLGVADILLRYGTDEFVALLTDVDSKTLATLADKIRKSVRTSPLTLRSKGAIDLDVRTAIVAGPQEGQSLGDVIRMAQRRIKLASKTDDSTIH